jgi:hypothetical protein
VEAYRFFTRLHDLLGLKARLESRHAAPAEELSHADPVAALRQLPAMLEQAARGVEAARRKDDERGRRTIDDYAETHAPAAEDPVVRRAWARARRLAAETQELLSRLLEPQKIVAPLALPMLPADVPAGRLWGAA